MKEIFEHIYSENIDRVAENRISFTLGSCDIVFEFEDEFEDENEFLDKYRQNYSLSELDFSIFNVNNLQNIFLRQFYNIEDNGFYEFDTSINCDLLKLLRCIKEKFPDSILKYNIDCLYVEQECEGWGCPDNYWYYGFEIQINSKYWTNIKFYDFLKSTNYNSFILPAFYNIEANLKDTFEINILNSNTKIRRLGYLKILLKMFKEYKKIPTAKLNSKFEKYCQDYNDYLKSHKNQKGNVIETKTGNSANPYIELALNIGLINRGAGFYQTGKLGKVYNILIEKIESQNENPFVLSDFDTSFFLEILLKNDFWYLYAIMEQAKITPKIAYKTLKKDFQKVLLKQIGNFIDYAQENNKEKVLTLKVIERRIKEWKKPEVFMEHILMPRLNWLYDMDFIELKNDLSFTLTATGEKLLYNLAVWNDIALYKLVSPVAYIDNYFMKMINFVFDFQKEKWTQNTDRTFEEYIEESFILFKTLAPNRVTFSLCSNYTKQMLFWNNKGIVDTENIKKVFEGKQISGYIYKYQEHYKDGYIQKNK
jgi:hypothetical protein